MKIKRYIAPAILTLLIAACGGGDGSTVETVGPMTKIVKHRNLKFVFDLQTKEKHMQMMQLMDAKMKHGEASNYFVSLTIIDSKTAKLISNADVTLTVSGPEGKNGPRPAALMQGKGMAHYIVGFAKTKPGKYAVSMKTTIAGAKHEHGVNFNLN